MPRAGGDTGSEEPFSRLLTKGPASLTLGFLFCKVGLFTAILQGCYGAWNAARLKTNNIWYSENKKIMVLATLYLLLLAIINFQITFSLSLEVDTLLLVKRASLCSGETNAAICYSCDLEQVTPLP